MFTLLVSALALQSASAVSFLSYNGTAGAVMTSQDEVVLQMARVPNEAPQQVKIKLHKDWAPIGVAQFQSLVSKGWFNDAGVFRVVPGFIVQFGLPAQPQPEPAALQDDPVKVSNKRGTLVFATAGPNTRTTQMFINLGDNAQLDGQGFAPIGEVTQGLDVVDNVNNQYGEEPDQGAITAQGNAYLDANFPQLTKIKSAQFR